MIIQAGRPAQRLGFKERRRNKMMSLQGLIRTDELNGSFYHNQIVCRKAFGLEVLIQPESMPVS